MADSSQRTEQPTKRRIDKARREGNFVATRSLISYAHFAVAAYLLVSAGPWLSQQLQLFVRQGLEHAFRFPEATIDAQPLLYLALRRMGLPLLLALTAILLTTLLLQLLLTQGGVAGSKLAPDLKRLDPLKQAQNLWSQNRIAFVQASLLLPAIAAGLAYELWRNWPTLLAAPLMSFGGGLAAVGGAASGLIWHSLLVLGLFGLGEFLWQLHRYRNELKMSKQEIREEFKEQEGDPYLKQRLRQMQRDLLRRKMMSEVPKATAVIVNPTHYAVAIRYRLDSPSAPKVVAKGKNYLAARIRERARENHIPIVENPPLARALYQAVPVGREIPPHLFRAVAEILAYIYRIMNGRLPG
jgi:flagellar biosynthetic protein FlhB